jgi:hypothetical protein
VGFGRAGGVLCGDTLVVRIDDAMQIADCEYPAYLKVQETP